VYYNLDPRLVYQRLPCVSVSLWMDYLDKKVKVKFSLSVGPGADPGVQAVSPQLTLSHLAGGRLRLLSARPAVSFQTHRPVPNYTAWRQRHMRVVQVCYLEMDRPRFEPATFWIVSERFVVTLHRPHWTQQEQTMY